MDDMIRWTVAVQNGELLDRGFLEELWTPVRLNSGEVFRMWNDQLGYGFGWMIVDFASGHHAVGGEGGTMNAWLYFPDEQLTVIVLTNKLRSDDIGIVTDVARFFITDLEVR
jgi:CubicO group peptidase (beta-lactamase class C family)